VSDKPSELTIRPPRAPSTVRSSQPGERHTGFPPPRSSSSVGSRQFSGGSSHTGGGPGYCIPEGYTLTQTDTTKVTHYEDGQPVVSESKSRTRKITGGNPMPVISENVQQMFYNTPPYPTRLVAPDGCVRDPGEVRPDQSASQVSTNYSRRSGQTAPSRRPSSYSGR
jgi:hypothetical protein